MEGVTFEARTGGFVRATFEGLEFNRVPYKGHVDLCVAGEQEGTEYASFERTDKTDWRQRQPSFKQEQRLTQAMCAEIRAWAGANPSTMADACGRTLADKVERAEAAMAEAEKAFKAAKAAVKAARKAHVEFCEKQGR